jgi:hypothetical protein
LGVRIALGVAAAVVLVLLAAQLFGPGIAAKKVRERVGRYGTVFSAHVSAFPAIELLWGHADSASVRAGSLSFTMSQGVDLLWEGRGVSDSDLSATSMQIERVRLGDVDVRKRGASIVLRGTISEAELKSVLPVGLQVHSLSDAGGHILAQATGELLGVSATVSVDIRPSEGKLVAEPQGVPLGGLATVTIFSDPRLRIEAVDVAPLGGASSAGGSSSLRLTLRASLLGS